ALSYAIEQANALKVPLVVVFFVWETGRDPQLRHYDFMLRGLADTAIQLRSKGIGFVLRRLEPVQGILDFSREVGACLVVTDRSPLNHGRLRRSKAATRLDVPLTQVDARFI
ncbi:deoxyribodipyrimidine photo-lyase, partial [Enterococcus faecium]|uniref:deoxyribodipyrimidine photo-lyase n=1 Tax=Enterococcus faecium TaxID=1352 RepID=UPI003F4324BE